MTPIYSGLEALTGRELTPADREALQRASVVAQRLQSQQLFHQAAFGSQTTILFCGRAALDAIVGVSAATCLDNRLAPYYILSGGVGFGVGVQVNAFVLLYAPSSYRSIAGSYVGGRGTLARGFIGGTLGYFWRETQPKDRLYWIGYAAGIAVDFDGMVINIQKI